MIRAGFVKTIPYEEWIDRIRIGVGSRRDDGVQPSAYPNNPSGLPVLRQERLLRASADFTMGRRMVGQTVSGENRVLSEELICVIFGILDLVSRHP